MHEGHHGGGHGKSLGELALELIMIGVGVFRGLQVDQWRERREHRDAARAALENFRTGIGRNRTRLIQTHAAHVALRDSIRAMDRRPAPRMIAEMFDAHPRLSTRRRARG